MKYPLLAKAEEPIDQMFDIEFSIYIASKENWVHLTKTIPMRCIPRVGEFIKFHSVELGDYFPWRVKEVAYHENGKIEISTDLLDNIDNRMYSFEDDSEFQDCLDAYLNEGWISPNGKKHNIYMNKKNYNQCQIL